MLCASLHESVALSTLVLRLTQLRSVSPNISGPKDRRAHVPQRTTLVSGIIIHPLTIHNRTTKVHLWCVM